jgi:hypothetical protein
MTRKLTFVPIEDSLYQWACRDMGETIHRHGCYELGWEPWSSLPNCEETYTVYFRFGEQVSKSVEAVTISEFYQLPIPTIPEPIIANSVSMDSIHRNVDTFLDFILKTDLAQEGGLVPLTSSRHQHLSRLVEGVVIDD